MNTYKPNVWNTLGALIGAASGVVIASNNFFYEEEILPYTGIVFGLFSAAILYPLLCVVGKRTRLVILWTAAWILLSCLSWFLAFSTYVNTAFGFDSSLLAVVAASSVGVTVLSILVLPLLRSNRISTYSLMILVGAIIAAFCTYISGDEFDGMLDGDNLDVIHIVWEAGLLYVITSVLYRQNYKGGYYGRQKSPNSISYSQ